MPRDQEPDYLLNDEQFVKLMERQFMMNGRPENAIANKKVWQRLQKKSGHKKFRWVAGPALIAALALFMVNRPQAVDETKSAHDASDYELSSVSGSERSVLRQDAQAIRLAVKSQTTITFSIFASGSQTVFPLRLRAGQILEARQTAQLEFSADELAPYDRVCLLAGENVSALDSVERMAEVLWTKLDEKHCLNLK